MSSSNCCFLTCLQISQEAGQVVWYSHLLKNFPQFVMFHTVKGFGIVSKAGRFWSWRVDAQEFPGGIPEADHVLAFCQASFSMTLLQVGFLTLAPGNQGDNIQP